jgi:hypothetical protein
MRRFDRPDIGSILPSVSPTSLGGGQWTDHLPQGDREPSLHACTKHLHVQSQYRAPQLLQFNSYFSTPGLAV